MKYLIFEDLNKQKLLFIIRGESCDV